MNATPPPRSVPLATMGNLCHSLHSYLDFHAFLLVSLAFFLPCVPLFLGLQKIT